VLGLFATLVRNSAYITSQEQERLKGEITGRIHEVETEIGRLLPPADPVAEAGVAEGARAHAARNQEANRAAAAGRMVPPGLD